MSSLNLIAGRLQQGKSTLAYHEAKREHKAVFVFDPGETFDNAEAMDLCFTIGALRDRVRAHADATGRRTMVLRSDAPERELPEFVDLVLGFADCSIIIDEASFFQSPHWLHPALSRLIRKGPKVAKNRDIFFTLHRPQDWNGLSASVAYSYTFFETTLDRDHERIANLCGETVAERVGKLGTREWLFYCVPSKKFYVNNAPDSWRENLTPLPPRRERDTELHPAAA